MSEPLLGAVVEIDITPPVGTPFDGYGARKESSIGIHDPLLAQLLLLRSGQAQAILVSLDLLGIGLDFTQQVRQGIEKAIGVPADCILLACSHTHSGSAGFLPPHPGIAAFQDPDLQHMVARQLIGASRWAEGRLQPARLDVGRGSVAGIGLNRNDPQGSPVDAEVLVLRVDSEAGQPIAVMMNHGCHPTVLGYQNLYFSADFPGATRSALRRVYPETIFLFTNGAAGDVSARFTRRDQSFGEVERLGRLLAGEVLKVMQVIVTKPEAKLEGFTQPVELPFRPFLPPEEARHELERLQWELEVLKTSNATHGEIRRAITRVEGAAGQALMARELAGRASNHSQVQVLKLGALALVGLPGETFTQTALEIKGSSPSSFTGVVSYANDYQGYFPGPASVEAGSYEALISPYDAGAAARLSRAAASLLERGHYV